MNWYREKVAQASMSSTGTWSVRGDNWLIILADKDLSRYYASLFNGSRPVLQEQVMLPKWGGHISVVRGEGTTNQELLQSLHDQPVEFTYEHNVEWNGKHAYLKVQCDEALDIREQLGLPREPLFPLHLTVGVVREI